MHLLIKIIFLSNDPLILDTWTVFMWILCQCAISLYRNTKIKFSLNTIYFQEISAVLYLFSFDFVLPRAVQCFRKGNI